MNRGFLSTGAGKLLVVGSVLIGVVLISHRFYRVVPSESRRIRQSAGYSMIAPDGWSPEMRRGSGKPGNGFPPTRDLIWLTPDQYVGASPSLAVKRLQGPPDAAALKTNGWVDGTFQDQPALIYTGQTKHEYQHFATFQRDGAWFVISQNLPANAKLDDDQWWQFLETFKYPDGDIQEDNVSTTQHASSTQPMSTQPIDF